MTNPASSLFLSAEDDLKINEIFRSLRERYAGYQDPWGFNIELCERSLRRLIPVYRKYFKVRVFGEENVKDHSYIVASNHSGQIPLDGMLIIIAFLIDVAPPRVLRAMVDRFMAKLPFIGDYSAQTGAILGERRNCEFLIDHGESILVFPEGLKGITKNTSEFYKLRPFSEGFYRTALQKKTPILPVCVIGAEEMYPFVFHAKSLAKFLRLPTLPLTANLIPLPSPIDIYIGPEIEIPPTLEAEASDKEVKEKVYEVEHTIKRMLIQGLKNRRPFLDLIRKPISKYVIRETKAKGAR
ncbi:MAG TPA: lysophospholipid acyltransferase family protein [Bacteriovoracaceae bacterium]|nr:lysophospholipid acyltransferase family protein [Bacteriovoracaceae bacterium]